MQGGRGATLGVEDTVEKGMGIALSSIKESVEGRKLDVYIAKCATFIVGRSIQTDIKCLVFSLRKISCHREAEAKA